jgi:hypothetical protein
VQLFIDVLYLLSLSIQMQWLVFLYVNALLTFCLLLFDHIL